MNKFEFIRYLLDEAESEKAYAKEYEKAEADYDKIPEDTPYMERYSHPFYRMRTPNKARIRENLKMVRRLTLEIEKEGVE